MKTPHDTPIEHRARVVRALRAIQQGVASNDPESLAVDRLASVAQYSRFHFTRLFSAMTGESVRTHIRRLKLERAAGDLVRTSESVIRIALRCGYNAHEPFTRAFTAHFGCSPTAFREQQRDPLTYPPCANSIHYGVDDAVSRFVPLIQENPMLDVKIEDQPERRTACLEHKGSYHAIGEKFARIGAIAGQAGLMGPNTEMLGVYLDNPEETTEDELTSYACCTIASDARIPDELEERIVPAGRYAVARYKGPFQRLDEAYKWLYGTWLAQSDHEPTDEPCYEIYRNEPHSVPPEENVIDIYVPLRA